MGERGGPPDMLLSRCGHERPKSSPSASSDFSGSSRLGQGHHSHPGPSQPAHLDKGAFLGTKCREMSSRAGPSRLMVTAFVLPSQVLAWVLLGIQ